LALLIFPCFEEHNGTTKMTDTAHSQTIDDLDGMLESGMEEGVTETMDRLAELVEKSKEQYMNPSERIDTQIAELADWRGQMIAQLRKLIREADPDLTEEWKWETAAWSHRGLVCAVGAFKETVKMNFFQGAFLEDPQKLFNAGLDAKKTRAIDFREGDAVDESALKELIRAAVAHNVGGNIG